MVDADTRPYGRSPGVARQRATRRSDGPGCEDPIGSSHEVVAVTDADRWPDIGAAVGRAVAAREVDYGIVMCWTGTGTAIAANKVPGVRAALTWDAWIAKGARLWNDANVPRHGQFTQDDKAFSDSPALRSSELLTGGSGSARSIDSAGGPTSGGRT